MDTKSALVTVLYLTGEGIHAGGVVDGQHGDARLLFEQIDGASRKGLQLLPDLLLVEAMGAGVHAAPALSLQQPWRNNIYAVYPINSSPSIYTSSPYRGFERCELEPRYVTSRFNMFSISTLCSSHDQMFALS